MALALMAASGYQPQNALSQDTIDPMVRIDIYFGVCPNIDAGPGVWAPWVQSVMGVLDDKQVPASSITPNQFHQITFGIWPYLCVADATALANNTGIWLAEFIPNSPQRGNGISPPCRVISTNTTFTLDDLTITTWFWNVAGSTNISIFDRYYPEARGKTADGAIVDSGPTSQQIKWFNFVGRRKAYTVHDQAGLDLIRDYVLTAVSGMSAKVELRRGGVVVARRQVDLPFKATTAPRLLIVRGAADTASLTVTGRANQYYRLQTSSLMSAWRDYGLPVLSGSPVTITTSCDQQFFRAVQRP